MSVRTRILIVDDEAAIHRFLSPALEASDYAVVSVATGADAVRKIAGAAPDAVILDLGLPDMDGKEVISKVRTFSDVPIVVLSARDREAEKIEALDLGADDYVNKPFGIGELLARVRTALRHRRGGAVEQPVFAVGPVEIDVPAHRATCSGVDLKLTPKEFDLLLLLARNAGKVMTHRQILAAIWGPAHVEDTQYLRVYVGQLRQKIEADPAEPKLILTEPGIGYRMGE
jgi:two-component system, OmpR family, KDP operon response regulator KdpE